MTLEEDKRIPQILERTILILKNKGNRPNVVMYGSLKTKNRKPLICFRQ